MPTSRAITLIGGRQIMQLSHPLVVGIRAEGTIGRTSERNPHYFKPRPHLDYLAETLYRLKCAVSLFVSSDPRSDATMWRQFASRDFRVGFDKLYDPDAQCYNGGRHARGLARCDFTDYLHKVAANVGTPPSRILFLDCELNYRFSPLQTLVLEKYEPVTARARRRGVHGSVTSPHTFSITTAVGAAVHGVPVAGSRHDEPRRMYEQRLAQAVTATDHATDQLRAEQAWASGSTPVQRVGQNSAVRARRAETRARAADDVLRATVAATAPFAVAGVDHVVTAPNTGHVTTSVHHAQPTPTSTPADCTLVAVAELLAELATRQDGVTEFLHREPLVEKLQVPNFDDEVYFLAAEDAEHVDLLEWEKITVQAEGTTGTADTVDASHSACDD